MNEEKLNKILELKAKRDEIDSELEKLLNPTAETPNKIETKLKGTLIKTLELKPFSSTLEEAIEKGEYNYVSDNIKDDFKDIDVKVDNCKVELVKFTEDFYFDDVIAWGKANKKTPISAEHLLTLGIQYPDEQKSAPIIACGSVRGGGVLYLGGYSGWRRLGRHSVSSDWGRVCLVGFLSE